MDAYNAIKQDITSFIRTWIKTGIIVNPQVGGDFFSNKDVISSKYSFFRDEEDYISNFAESYENGRYLCALSDGSFFQINYLFEHHSKRKQYISKASLSYLPCVTDGAYANDYIRMDYDAESQNYFHPAAHLHVGFKGNFRLAADELLCFSEFFKFMMYLYYPDIYLKLEKKEDIKHTPMEEEGKYTKNIPISKELKEFVYFTASQIR